MRILALLALLALPVIAVGEVLPQGGHDDMRVKTVDYRPDDVTKIVGHYGFSTVIQFATDESVADIALGDTAAWSVANRGRRIFIKPSEANAATNMTVVTSKDRTYHFVLTAHQSQSGASPIPNDMFFAVTFRYPEDEAEAARLAAEAEASRKALDVEPKVRNTDYWTCGSSVIQPDKAFDDGRFTYLAFAANREMPAIYEVTEDGESLVNTHVEGDYIVIHRVAPKFVLRKGKAVACVENRSYDPIGISTPSGTISDAVERVER